MPPFACGKRRFASGRASAHYNDFLFPLRRLKFQRNPVLAPVPRVDRTLNIRMLCSRMITVHTPDTWNDILAPSLHSLARQIRIRIQRPPHCHRIHDPVRDQTLRLLRRHNGAHDTDQLVRETLLYFSRPVYIRHLRLKDGLTVLAVHTVPFLQPAFRVNHMTFREVPRYHIHSTGYIDQIHLVFDPLQKRHHILKTVRSFQIIAGAKQDHNRIIRSHSSPYRIHMLDCKPHPVFQRTSVFIRPVVKCRRQKLRCQFLISDIKVHKIKSELLNRQGVIIRLPHNACDVLAGQFHCPFAAARQIGRRRHDRFSIIVCPDISRRIAFQTGHTPGSGLRSVLPRNRD